MTSRFTIPSWEYTKNLGLIILLDHHTFLSWIFSSSSHCPNSKLGKTWARDWFLPFACACPGGPLLPAALIPPIVGISPRNAMPTVSQNTLTGRLHSKGSQCKASSCEGLQPDLPCAWNPRASPGGESTQRCVNPFPLIPQPSQILASPVTPQSPCRTVSPLSWRQLLWNFASETDWNAGNLICHTRCSQTASLYR